MVQGCLKVALGSSGGLAFPLSRPQQSSADGILLVARAMRWNPCPDFEAALCHGPAVEGSDSRPKRVSTDEGLNRFGCTILIGFRLNRIGCGTCPRSENGADSCRLAASECRTCGPDRKAEIFAGDQSDGRDHWHHSKDADHQPKHCGSGLSTRSAQGPHPLGVCRQTHHDRTENHIGQPNALRCLLHRCEHANDMFRSALWTGMITLRLGIMPL